MIRRILTPPFLLVVLFCSLASAVYGEVKDNEKSVTCSEAGEKDESCMDEGREKERELVCGIQSRCGTAGGGSIYRHGGSAQSYKPDAPLKSSVCDTSGEVGNKRSRPRIATWPFSRAIRKGDPPVLHVRGRVWACSTASDQCCCELLESDSTERPIMEVWQARPDGTYSSLTADENGDCRATVPMRNSAFEFETLLPGSTGAFGGLGPFEWDNFPYGPPVVHFLITANNCEPLLVNVPVSADRSLQPSSFWGPDLRGHSLAGPRKKEVTAYQVDSWEVKGNDIQLEIDFYLAKEESEESLHQTMCPSSVYGFPSSFFFEPITLCAPSILDFFAL